MNNLGTLAPADYDRCRVGTRIHIDSGEVDDMDVGGLTVAVVADTPPVMADGNWRVGVIMDTAASERQAERFGAVFPGQVGGPMATLAPLITEMLGVELSRSSTQTTAAATGQDR